LTVLSFSKEGDIGTFKVLAIVRCLAFLINQEGPDETPSSPGRIAVQVHMADHIVLFVLSVKEQSTFFTFQIGRYAIELELVCMPELEHGVREAMSKTIRV
jgi:hypothetical protein